MFLLQCNAQDTMSWRTANGKQFFAGGSIKEVIVNDRSDVVSLLRKQRDNKAMFTLINDNYQLLIVEIVEEEVNGNIDMLKNLEQVEVKDILFDFIQIKGIGEATQKRIYANGYTTHESVLENREIFIQEFGDELYGKIEQWQEVSEKE